MSCAIKLAALLDEANLPPLTERQSELFDLYLGLFLKWNEKTNLSAVRDEDQILRRHILESIACAHALPTGLTTLLDFGSGGGFPGIPIAILHPQIQITLAESQIKKAAFLAETVRSLQFNCKIHSARAELLRAEFDCVTLRAVDKMTEAVKAASRLINEHGWLTLMTTTREMAAHQSAAGSDFQWQKPVALYASDSRIILIGQRL